MHAIVAHPTDLQILAARLLRRELGAEESSLEIETGASRGVVLLRWEALRTWRAIDVDGRVMTACPKSDFAPISISAEVDVSQLWAMPYSEHSELMEITAVEGDSVKVHVRGRQLQAGADRDRVVRIFDLLTDGRRLS